MKAVGKLETLQMAAVPLLLPRQPISSQKQGYISCFCVELRGEIFKTRFGTKTRKVWLFWCFERQKMMLQLLNVSLRWGRQPGGHALIMWTVTFCTWALPLRSYTSHNACVWHHWVGPTTMSKPRQRCRSSLKCVAILLPALRERFIESHGDAKFSQFRSWAEPARTRVMRLLCI